MDLCDKLLMVTYASSLQTHYKGRAFSIAVEPDCSVNCRLWEGSHEDD